MADQHCDVHIAGVRGLWGVVAVGAIVVLGYAAAKLSYLGLILAEQLAPRFGFSLKSTTCAAQCCATRPLSSVPFVAAVVIQALRDRIGSIMASVFVSSLAFVVVSLLKVNDSMRPIGREAGITVLFTIGAVAFWSAALRFIFHWIILAFAGPTQRIGAISTEATRIFRVLACRFQAMTLFTSLVLASAVAGLVPTLSNLARDAIVIVHLQGVAITLLVIGVWTVYEQGGELIRTVSTLVDDQPTTGGNARGRKPDYPHRHLPRSRQARQQACSCPCAVCSEDGVRRVTPSSTVQRILDEAAPSPKPGSEPLRSAVRKVGTTTEGSSPIAAGATLIGSPLTSTPARSLRAPAGAISARGGAGISTAQIIIPGPSSGSSSRWKPPGASPKAGLPPASDSATESGFTGRQPPPASDPHGSSRPSSRGTTGASLAYELDAVDGGSSQHHRRSRLKQHRTSVDGNDDEDAEANIHEDGDTGRRRTELDLPLSNDGDEDEDAEDEDNERRTMKRGSNDELDEFPAFVDAAGRLAHFKAGEAKLVSASGAYAPSRTAAASAPQTQPTLLVAPAGQFERASPRKPTAAAPHAVPRAATTVAPRRPLTLKLMTVANYMPATRRSPWGLQPAAPRARACSDSPAELASRLVSMTAQPHLSPAETSAQVTGTSDALLLRPMAAKSVFASMRAAAVHGDVSSTATASAGATEAGVPLRPQLSRRMRLVALSDPNLLESVRQQELPVIGRSAADTDVAAADGAARRGLSVPGRYRILGLPSAPGGEKSSVDSQDDSSGARPRAAVPFNGTGAAAPHPSHPPGVAPAAHQASPVIAWMQSPDVAQLTMLPAPTIREARLAAAKHAADAMSERANAALDQPELLSRAGSPWRSIPQTAGSPVPVWRSWAPGPHSEFVTRLLARAGRRPSQAALIRTGSELFTLRGEVWRRLPALGHRLRTARRSDLNPLHRGVVRMNRQTRKIRVTLDRFRRFRFVMVTQTLQHAVFIMAFAWWDFLRSKIDWELPISWAFGHLMTMYVLWLLRTPRAKRAAVDMRSAKRRLAEAAPRRMAQRRPTGLVSSSLSVLSTEVSPVAHRRAALPPTPLSVVERKLHQVCVLASWCCVMNASDLFPDAA